MAKDKGSDKGKSKDKKKSKKTRQHDGLLGNAAKSLKQFREVTRNVTKLSTGQKVVGGIALLAAGLTYLAKKHSEDSASGATPDAQAAEAHLSALTQTEDPAPAAPEPERVVPLTPAPIPTAGKKARKQR